MEGYPKLAAVGGEEKGIVPRAVYSSACAKQRTGKLLPFALVGEVVLFVIAFEFQKAETIFLRVAVVCRKANVKLSVLLDKTAALVDLSRFKLPGECGT